MIAKNLITTDIPVIKTSDTGGEILNLMSIFCVRHLPIVNNEQYLGILSEDDVYQNDDSAPIGSYPLSLSKAYVSEDDHLFEIMSVMSQHKLTIIPVIDNNGDYIGAISQEDLLHYYATSFSFTEQGSILVIETAKNNYSLVEISSIVEQENAVILGTFLSTQQDANRVQITLKINKTDISHIIASFERHDYAIVGSFYEDEYFNNLKSRYDALMNYLSI